MDNEWRNLIDFGPGVIGQSQPPLRGNATLCVVQVHVFFFHDNVSIPAQQRWSGYSDVAVCEWVSVWVFVCARHLLWCGHYTDYSFLNHFHTSNFTCKLWVMKGGTHLILGQWTKGQGQLWHPVYITLWTWYRLQILPDHFQTSHASCWLWEEEPYWFWSQGQKPWSTL